MALIAAGTGMLIAEAVEVTGLAAYIAGAVTAGEMAYEGVEMVSGASTMLGMMADTAVAETVGMETATAGRLVAGAVPGLGAAVSAFDASTLGTAVGSNMAGMTGEALVARGVAWKAGEYGVYRGYKRLKPGHGGETPPPTPRPPIPFTPGVPPHRPGEGRRGPRDPGRSDNRASHGMGRGTHPDNVPGFSRESPHTPNSGGGGHGQQGEDARSFLISHHNRFLAHAANPGFKHAMAYGRATGIPDKRTMKHRWCEAMVPIVVTTTGGACARNFYAANRIRLPDVEAVGAGHDAIMWDQMRGIYARYTVVGATIRVDYHNSQQNSAASEGAIMGVAIKDDITTQAVVGHYQEADDRCVWKPVSAEGSGTLVMSVKPHEFFGIKHPLSEADMACIEEAAPTNDLWFHVFAHSQKDTGAGTQHSVHGTITIEYTVVWSQPISPAQS